MNTALKVSLSLFLLCLTACGWQLRGSNGDAIMIKRLYVSTDTPESAFTQVLNRHLQSSNIELVTSAAQAQYSLSITREKSIQRTATVSASARISERLLNEQVWYLLLNSDGTIALEQTVASVERIFEYNEDNVLATDDEAHMLRAEMHNDLARQISNRLRQLLPSSHAPTP